MSITMTTVILFAVFGVLLFLGVPISISIVASSIVTAMSTLSWDQITFITMQKMNSGVESFSLLAVPLFILAGNIMNNGGIAKRLVNFAQLFVGKIPGSMAQANILGNMLFGALSGSSVAAASAMGGCISPIEEENGYDPAYSAAANIASAPTGLLIPPTSAFIVYSTVAGGVSISTLFMAGYIPGILMGLCCMVVAFIGAKKAGMKATGIDHSQSIAKTVWDAVPSLLLIVIVIGGIVSGIFTATEGAGVAVLYCLILSIIYKSIDFKGFLGILLNSAKTSGIILFLISASSAMSVPFGTPLLSRPIAAIGLPAALPCIVSRPGLLPDIRPLRPSFPGIHPTHDRLLFSASALPRYSLSWHPPSSPPPFLVPSRPFSSLLVPSSPRLVPSSVFPVSGPGRAGRFFGRPAILA